jgi:imidazolonepropionase-like amidohydrolase
MFGMHENFRYMVALSLATLFSVTACAQEAPQNSLVDAAVISGVRVIDGLGDAPKENQDILIGDGKIVAIGSAGSLAVPDNVAKIDGNGMTAMPGLIDMHIHTQGGWGNGLIAGERYAVSNEDEAVQQRQNGYLYAGVTTTLDLGVDHKWVVAKRDEINSGKVIGPRAFIVGSPWSQAPSGWDSGNTSEGGEAFGESTKVTDFAKIPTQMQRYTDDGIEIIKLYSGISAMAMQEVIKEANKRDILTVADFWGMNMNRMLMQLTGLHGWGHTGSFGEVSVEDIQWMADNDKFVISTMTVSEKLAGMRVIDENGQKLMLSESLIVDIWGEDEVEEFYRVYPQIREEYYEGPESFYQVSNFGDLSKFRDYGMHNIKIAYDVGMQIACGTDDIYASLWPGEAMHREMELLVMAGIPALEVITMCTSEAAKILRREDKFGTLQAGLSADILIVEGNPAENISDSRNVKHVFFKGKPINRDALKFNQR